MIMLLIRLVSLATFSPLILAQSSGTIYLNASNPSSGSPTAGCVILGQLAVLSTPHILTAMVPICPSTAGDLASEPLTGMPITWPLTTGGDGAASAMAIYAGITESDDGKSTARCVMNLSQMQAMYLLGRDLDWNNDQNQLWDYTANGWLRDTSKYNVITCGADGSLLPLGLELPNPYKWAASNEVWSQLITLTAATASSSAEASDSATPATSFEPTTSAEAITSAEITASSTSLSSTFAVDRSSSAAASTDSPQTATSFTSFDGATASYTFSSSAYSVNSTVFADSSTVAVISGPITPADTTTDSLAASHADSRSVSDVATPTGNSSKNSSTPTSFFSAPYTTEPFTPTFASSSISTSNSSTQLSSTLLVINSSTAVVVSATAVSSLTPFSSVTAILSSTAVLADNSSGTPTTSSIVLLNASTISDSSDSFTMQTTGTGEQINSATTTIAASATLSSTDTTTTTAAIASTSLAIVPVTPTETTSSRASTGLIITASQTSPSQSASSTLASPDESSVPNNTPSASATSGLPDTGATRSPVPTTASSQIDTTPSNFVSTGPSPHGDISASLAPAGPSDSDSETSSPGILSVTGTIDVSSLPTPVVINASISRNALTSILGASTTCDCETSTTTITTTVHLASPTSDSEDAFPPSATSDTGEDPTSSSDLVGAGAAPTDSPVDTPTSSSTSSDPGPASANSPADLNPSASVNDTPDPTSSSTTVDPAPTTSVTVAAPITSTTRPYTYHPPATTTTTLPPPPPTTTPPPFSSSSTPPPPSTSSPDPPPGPSSTTPPPAPSATPTSSFVFTDGSSTIGVFSPTSAIPLPHTAAKAKQQAARAAATQRHQTGRRSARYKKHRLP